MPWRYDKIWSGGKSDASLVLVCSECAQELAVPRKRDYKGTYYSSDKDAGKISPMDEKTMKQAMDKGN